MLDVTSEITPIGAGRGGELEQLNEELSESLIGEGQQQRRNISSFQRAGTGAGLMRSHFGASKTNTRCCDGSEMSNVAMPSFIRALSRRSCAKSQSTKDTDINIYTCPLFLSVSLWKHMPCNYFKQSAGWL